MNIPKSKREVIATKIRALIALSQNEGATEHEAMLAAERASDMMSKYAIATADLQLTETVEESWGFRRKAFPNREHYVRYCILAIGRFTDCIPTWYNDQSILSYFGTRMDTEVAHWLVGMLRDTIDRESAAYVASVKGKVHAKTARVSFEQGMVIRLAKRLAELKEAQEGNIGRTLGSTALVVSKKAELKSKAAENNVPDPEQANKAPNMHTASMQAGEAAGDRVAFNAALKDGSNATKALGDH